ncbi:MAG: PDZ domain-containing protein, partial [Pyramidobacter sp.]|nr:PDZ domain-containing protein [Pyramidobacter sp.]
MDLERPNGERYHVELAVDYIPAQTERCKEFFGIDDADPGRTREQVYASAPRYVPPMTPEMKRQLEAQQAIGFAFDDDGTVTEVLKDAIADKAGLKAGDVITEHNLVSIKQTGAAKMREDIERRVTGGLVSMLTLRRNGKEVIVKLRK